jgi:hypothetical protein
MTRIEKRQQAVKQTAAKFGAKPFKWGGNDCAKMAAFHLKQFGHKVPQTGGYRSALTAKKRLKAMGFETLPELISSLGLVEQPWAFAKMGDIVSFESDDPIGAIGIVWGNGNMMCFHESALTPVIMTMDKIDKCWSVL